MKILLVSSSSGSRGGGELFLLRLGRGLVERGHEPVLWASSDGRMDELCRHFESIGRVVRSPYRNTYDYRARCLSTLWNWGDSWRIAQEWKRIGCDIVHVNKQNLEDGLDLVRAAKWSGLPTVCTVHLTQTAMELGAKSARVRDWTARHVLKSYPGCFVTVEESRSYALRAFLSDEVEVKTVENGVEPFDRSLKISQRPATRKAAGWNDSAFIVCCVGRMVPQKRPLLFLEVAFKFIAQDSQARFVWIGDGELAGEWDERVAAAGAHEFIQRIPWQKDVAPYLAAADLYLHTAAYEGCPFALLEAMSAGLPCVVASDLLQSMPMLQDNEVIAFDPVCGLSAVELAPERLHRAATAGVKATESRFSLGNMARRYEETYLQAALIPRE